MPTTNIVVHGNCLYSTTAINLNFDQALSETLIHDMYQLLRTDTFEQKKKSIHFLMNLKGERLMTQAAGKDVFSGIKEVFERSIGRLRA